MTITYVYDKSPETSDDTMIRHGIQDFNQTILKETASHFSLFAKETEIIIAGALIWQHGDALYIDTLWCSEPYRRQGIGSTLMVMLLDIALTKAVTQIFVDTYDFQAQDFYQTHGFECISIVPRYLLNYNRIFLKKSL